MSAGPLTMIYMDIVGFHYRRPSQALILGLGAFVLVIPSLYYAYPHFSAANPGISLQAHRIVVEKRIPHHALPRVWFDGSEALKILILLAATYAATELRLRLIFGVSILVGTALTLMQLVTGSLSLALLFPWRVSAFVMSLASALLLPRTLSFLLHFARPFLDGWRSKGRWLVVGVTEALVIVACKQTIRWVTAPREGLCSVTRLAHRSYQSGNRYLIPPKLSNFRIAPQLPAFVDNESHPYKDVEVVEWNNRLNLAEEFYAAPDGCVSLLKLQHEYGITHVVTFRKKKQPKCELLDRMSKDQKWFLIGCGPYPTRCDPSTGKVRTAQLRGRFPFSLEARTSSCFTLSLTMRLMSA